MLDICNSQYLIDPNGLAAQRKFVLVGKWVRSSWNFELAAGPLHDVGRFFTYPE